MARISPNPLVSCIHWRWRVSYEKLGSFSISNLYSQSLVRPLPQPPRGTPPLCPIVPSPKRTQLQLPPCLQGTSILSPVIPFSLVVVPAFIIFQKSESSVYENHPALYILCFGMVAAKVTNRLVVSSAVLA